MSAQLTLGNLVCYESTHTTHTNAVAWCRARHCISRGLSSDSKHQEHKLSGNPSEQKPYPKFCSRWFLWRILQAITPISASFPPFIWKVGSGDLCLFKEISSFHLMIFVFLVSHLHLCFCCALPSYKGPWKKQTNSSGSLRPQIKYTKICFAARRSCAYPQSVSMLRAQAVTGVSSGPKETHIEKTNSSKHNKFLITLLFLRVRLCFCSVRVPWPIWLCPAKWVCMKIRNPQSFSFSLSIPQFQTCPNIYCNIL